MSDNLTICAYCKGDACYEVKNETFTMWSCFGCGYSTCTFWNKSNDKFEETQEVIPELYKDIAWVDENGNYWYPQTINIKGKGIVFAEGKTKDNWKWCAVKFTPLNPREKYKFAPGTTHKIDMTTKKQFDQKDFMDALEFINFFKTGLSGSTGTT